MVNPRAAIFRIVLVEQRRKTPTKKVSSIDSVSVEPGTREWNTLGLDFTYTSQTARETRHCFTNGPPRPPCALPSSRGVGAGCYGEPGLSSSFSILSWSSSRYSASLGSIPSLSARRCLAKVCLSSVVMSGSRCRLSSSPPSTAILLSSYPPNILLHQDHRRAPPCRWPRMPKAGPPRTPGGLLPPRLKIPARPKKVRSRSDPRHAFYPGGRPALPQPALSQSALSQPARDPSPTLSHRSGVLPVNRIAVRSTGKPDAESGRRDGGCRDFGTGKAPSGAGAFGWACRTRTRGGAARTPHTRPNSPR